MQEQKNGKSNFKTRYSKRNHKGIKFTKPSLTRQADAKDCDINNIMKKFEQTGQLPDMIKENPQFGDFSNYEDYQSSMNLVLHAEQQFAALPSSVRKKFDNDPKQFLSFANDPNNMSEMVDLGLAEPHVMTEAESNVPKVIETPKKDVSGPEKGPQGAG